MGPVETATRAMVKALGALSTPQAVTAAAAVRVAGYLDEESDGSKASALSRELRQLMVRLVPQVGVGSPVGDVVAQLQDEVAKQRAKRTKSAG